MSTTAISNSPVQHVISTTLQSGDKPTQPTAAEALPKSDSAQVSPFAQLVHTLHKLQKSDPVKYAQVTKQIATNLQSAAQTAQSQGNSAAASQLNQLASDFSQASQSGQIPNLQSLSSTSGDNAGNTGAGAPLHHLLSLFQASANLGLDRTSINPQAVVLQTLTNAGSKVLGA